MRVVFFVSIPSMVGLIVLGRPIIRLFLKGVCLMPFQRHDLPRPYGLLLGPVGLLRHQGDGLGLLCVSGHEDTCESGHLFPPGQPGLESTSHGSHGTQWACLGAYPVVIHSNGHHGLLSEDKDNRVGCEIHSPVRGKSLLASAIMGLAIHYMGSYWSPPHAVSGAVVSGLHLAALIVLGLLVYLVTALILGCREIESILNRIRRFRS